MWRLLSSPISYKAEHSWDVEESCARSRRKRDFFNSKLSEFFEKLISASTQLRISTKDSSEAWKKQSSGVFSTSILMVLLAPPRVIDLLSAPSKPRGWNLGKGLSWQARKSYLKYSFSALISDISQLGWVLSWAIKQKDRGWFDAEE